MVYIYPMNVKSIECTINCTKKCTNNCAINYIPHIYYYLSMSNSRLKVHKGRREGNKMATRWTWESTRTSENPPGQPAVQGMWNRGGVGREEIKWPPRWTWAIAREWRSIGVRRQNKSISNAPFFVHFYAQFICTFFCTIFCTFLCTIFCALDILFVIFRANKKHYKYLCFIFSNHQFFISIKF